MQRDQDRQNFSPKSCNQYDSKVPKFDDVTNHIIFNIRNNSDPFKYHVLLIITDGAIMDMPDTISALVQGSFLPLSVVIVGVGWADFSSMDELDADGKGLVDRTGIKAARDIVQFVPFNKFMNNPSKLPEQVLCEIPKQVTDYYKMINKPPGEYLGY
jgi:hypothetical protein